MRVEENAAVSARLANNAGQMALCMKKKYDSMQKVNIPDSSSPKSKLPNKISTGTGFFISDNGYLLTNSHVVNGSSKLSIFLNGTKIQASLIDQDVSNDIALLKIDKPVKGLACVHFFIYFLLAKGYIEVLKEVCLDIEKRYQVKFLEKGLEYQKLYKHRQLFLSGR